MVSFWPCGPTWLTAPPEAQASQAKGQQGQQQQEPGMVDRHWTHRHQDQRLNRIMVTSAVLVVTKFQTEPSPMI